MKQLTYQFIKDLSPCYDPIKHIPKDWMGTPVDLLEMQNNPMQDVLWVICREGVLDNGIMRRFAARCAAEALFVSKQTDSHSWYAVEVAIKFSLGQATNDERDAAWDAARDAAWDAARAAQRVKLISMLKKESDFTLSDLLNNYPIERT